MVKEYIRKQKETKIMKGRTNENIRKYIEKKNTLFCQSVTERPAQSISIGTTKLNS